MKTTINIPDDLVREIETVYKANSRSESIKKALEDALQKKKLEQLKRMVGKIEFDEKAIYETRDKDR